MTSLYAKRDMTSREFAAALKRNGFKYDFLFWFIDTTGTTPNIHFPGVFRRDGSVMRRSTISHLIRARDAAVKREQNAVTITPSIKQREAA